MQLFRILATMHPERLVLSGIFVALIGLLFCCSVNEYVIWLCCWISARYIFSLLQLLILGKSMAIHSTCC